MRDVNLIESQSTLDKGGFKLHYQGIIRVNNAQ